jgi:hypothetical protein
VAIEHLVAKLRLKEANSRTELLGGGGEESPGRELLKIRSSSRRMQR